MPAHLTRAIEAFSLLILATIVIAGILSTHSSPAIHVVADGSSASTVAAHGDGPTSTVQTSDAATELSVSSVEVCRAADGPQCCSEPVDCIETATAIPPVLAVTAAPARTFHSPALIAPLTADDRGTIPPRAPSLTLLSISRT